VIEDRTLGLKPLILFETEKVICPIF